MSELPLNWETMRQQVYQRDKYECQNCGSQPEGNSDSSLDAHHIVPRQQGGSNKLSNLISLCSDCHDAVHGDTMAPTCAPEEHNETLDTFAAESPTNSLQSHLKSKYGRDEIVENILKRLNLESPISHEELTKAETEGLTEWDPWATQSVVPVAIMKRPKEFEDIAAEEIARLRD